MAAGRRRRQERRAWRGRRPLDEVSFSGGGTAALTMLAHNVYFALKDKSPAAKAALVAACKKYLTGHPGTVFFAAGTLAEELQREVNVRDFDVALHLVFA